MALEDHPLTRFIGNQVIVRSNDQEPAWVATLSGVTEIHSSVLPVITDSQGKEYVSFSILVPYRPEMLAMLNAMPPKEAWTFCVAFSDLTQARHAD